MGITFLALSSCGMHNIITTPMKMVGTVASFVPGVGDDIDEGLTKSADIINVLAE